MSSEIIKSRDDFYRVLNDAIRMCGDRIRALPKFQVLEEIEIQLDAMWRWSVDGRTPTQDERDSIGIGPLAVRELEPADTEADADFASALHELNYYFAHWPDDPNEPANPPPFYQR